MLENVESEQSLIVSIHTIYSLKNFGRILSTIGLKKKTNRKSKTNQLIGLCDFVLLFLYNSEDCWQQKEPSWNRKLVQII